MFENNNPNRPHIRTPYNYDTKAASIETGLSCSDPSRTLQSEKDDADINVMMERFGQAAKIPQGHQIPRYGDFSHVGDYHAACNEIAAAGEAFDALPALIRERFHNDPGEYVKFCLETNAEGEVVNHAEMVKMGLIQPPPADASFLKAKDFEGIAAAIAAANQSANAQDKAD